MSKADHVVDARHGGRAGRADDAPRRAGQDGVLAAEGAGLGEAAMGLHEVEARSAEFRGDLLDVAAQDGRQIRVHHRRIGAGNKAQERTDLVAGRHLGEAGLAGDGGEPPLVLRVPPTVDQGDRAGRDAVRHGALEGGAGRVLVERLDLVAVDADAARDLHHALVEQGRQPDVEVEQARPALGADAQRVGEAAVDDEQRALALALEQRVGGHRRAHPHRVDRAGRDDRAGGQSEDLAYARDRRIAGSVPGSRSGACGSTGGRRARGRRRR